MPKKESTSKPPGPVDHGDDAMQFLRDNRANLAERVREITRQLVAGSRVTQRELARVLGYSQSAISHMLNDRSYEPTPSEIHTIERLVGVPVGSVYKACGLCSTPTAESLIYGDGRIEPAAADALVAGIASARTFRERQDAAQQERMSWIEQRSDA